MNVIPTFPRQSFNFEIISLETDWKILDKIFVAETKTIKMREPFIIFSH